LDGPYVLRTSEGTDPALAARVGRHVGIEASESGSRR
jgi:hypothetical protein